MDVATEGGLCEVCYTGHFAVENGLLICDQCGTQSQVPESFVFVPLVYYVLGDENWDSLLLPCQAFQEEAHEVEVGGLGRAARVLKQAAPKQRPPTLSCGEVVEVYCACLQRQLQVGRSSLTPS